MRLFHQDYGASEFEDDMVEPAIMMGWVDSPDKYFMPEPDVAWLDKWKRDRAKKAKSEALAEKVRLGRAAVNDRK